MTFYLLALCDFFFGLSLIIFDYICEKVHYHAKKNKNLGLWVESTLLYVVFKYWRIKYLVSRETGG